MNEEKEASDIIDDGDELDSLDDGLHAFREPSSHHTFRWPDHNGGTILPAHDGLGLFAPSSSLVQEQLRSSEKHKHNPKTITDRRETASGLVAQRYAAEDECEPTWMDDARMERIEKWRLEQSRLLLEQVKGGSGPWPLSSGTDQVGNRSSDPEILDTTLLSGPKTSSEAVKDQGVEHVEKEAIWRRLAKRVIRDLIGLDESLLCVIFGESLPEENDNYGRTTSIQTSNPQNGEEGSARHSHEGWEDRVLQRIARKLNLLIYQLSFHPSMPNEITNVTMDYAGIPVDESYDTIQGSGRRGDFETNDSLSAQFKPTLQEKGEKASVNGDISRWDVEEHQENLPPYSAAEAEYWEQTPNLKTVLSYLGQHFITRQSSNSETARPVDATTFCTPRSLRRAAIIRQQHPLMTSRRRAQERNGRPSTLRRMYQTNNGMSLVGSSLKRTGQSCASLSTKRSKRDTSVCGSRNYWDIGGSLGSSSAVLGGTGTWGEV